MQIMLCLAPEQVERSEIEEHHVGVGAPAHGLHHRDRVVSWRARAFAPGARVLERILERWPLAA